MTDQLDKLDKFLTKDEKATVTALETKLANHGIANHKVGKYYDEDYRIRNVGVIPDLPRLKETVMGWGTTVVDTLEERVNLTGWTTPDADDEQRDTLDNLFSVSGAAEESHQGHLDAFIYGIGFISVTKGGPGEPPVLVRAHSALSATADIDPRTGLARSAITRQSRTSQTLWTPNMIIEMTRVTDGGMWQVTNRIPNSLGRCLVVPLVNRSRAGDRRGRSEITPAIRSYINSATRSLKAMDVNREFFSAPQRYGTNVSPDQFVDADGNQVSGWKLSSRQMLMAPTDESGAEPKFGEFSTVSPGPYLEQIRGLAGLVATEAGMPEDYLGIHSSNPSSADAIRMQESRLVSRAKRRQNMFAPAWNEIGRLALAILSGTTVENVPYVISKFDNPATPTTAATVDALVKLIQVGALPKNSEVVREKAELFDEVDLRRLRDEMERQRSDDRIVAMAAMARGGAATAAMEEDTGDSSY
ncbi:phage portal protein [Corynebacterium glyciniphilum]|uniref:phage portal protein n=1 Tax=Corynebacterium glyciniphilum TaxID=1404244 RepID=UPI00264CEB50|nr:phage portal protein [Corynebacterium glyciniphilum]MDN6706385.1 phage portal protein [Corynebacterium glyciniphilum]